MSRPAVKNRMSADHQRLKQHLDAHHLRIEKIVYLAASLTDPLPDELCDFFDDKELGDIERTLACAFPEDLRNYLREDEACYASTEIGAWLTENGKLGFLCEFATPLDPTMPAPWNTYRRGWFYGETVHAAIHDASAWASLLNTERE